MANKKYFTDESLSTFVSEIKSHTSDAVSNHNHDNRYYTENEIDTKIAGINASIGNITSGTVVVQEAEHASSADTANSANTANSATNADHAQTATTASKLGSETIGSSNQPVYINAGTATKISAVDIAYGGTGATTAADALTNLGITATATELNKLDGVTATTAQLNYLKGVTSDIQTQLNNKADTSHGNHVPATETANNKKFLRNDNTWQTVTPANIGAADSSHTHAASEINSGTLSTDRLPTIPVSKGGTNATTAAGARTNLDVYSKEEVNTALDVINEEIDDAITGLSVSGKTITYTKKDGSTGTITTQDTNDDTKVNVTLGTTTKAYLLGTSTTPTSTAKGVTAISDTGVYLDTTAGQLVATKFKGDLDGNAKTATTSSKLGSSTVGGSSQPVYLNAGVATKVSSVGVEYGGTGATTAESARTNLGVYSKTEVDTKVSNAVSGLASTGNVTSAISTHNSATDAHSDIRQTLAEVKGDVDAFFKDATISDAAKDTLKEIQDYITTDTAAAAEMTASINNKAPKSHASDQTTYGIGTSSNYGHVKLSDSTSSSDSAASSGIAASPKAVKTAYDLANTAKTNAATAQSTADTAKTNAATAKTRADEAYDLANTHTHGNITNAGAIGTSANKAVITTTNGVLTTGTVPVASGGTGATTAAAALTNLGITATAAELNYTDGVTSNIQTQLNNLGNKKYWADLELSTSTNKGTTPTFSPDFKVDIGSNSVVTAAANKAISMPTGKYVWHDILAFGVNGHPTVETSTNGTTWTETTDDTLKKKLFIQREDQTVTVLSDARPAIRWTWYNSSFHACQASYLNIGFAYSASQATFNILFETSPDGTTWTTGFTKTGVKYTSAPYWFYLTSAWSQHYYVRLTLTRTSAAGTSAAISGIKLLSSRWGNQGRGSEYENPYSWDENQNIYPKNNNTSTLGTASNKWSNVYATTFTGNLSGNATGLTGLTSTIAELNYMDGVTSNVQEQIDTLGNGLSGKASSSHTHTVSHTPAGTVSKPTFTGTAATSGAPSESSTVASSTHTHKYTPSGTVSKPTFTGTAATSGAPSGTTTVNSITAVGTLPSLSASVTNRCLTLTFGAGTLPTKGADVSVATGTHTHSVTATGNVSQPTFTGTEASTTSITGTTSVASSAHTHSVTATGNVSQPTFTGTAATITSSTPK